MTVANAADVTKTVADPNAEYESLKSLWDRCRAVCSGERFVKDYDSYLDHSYRNLLIPFSPTMTQEQYDFYRSEAELPGIVSQFTKMLVGGLLRKVPEITFPDGTPDDVINWITYEFSQDDSPLVAFLDDALWEEIQTSRAWVYVDFPAIQNPEMLTPEQLKEIQPYPVLWKAENVINWKIRTNQFGKKQLAMVITRGFEESVLGSENEFHSTLRDTVRVHDIDEFGKYRIRVYQKQDDAVSVSVVSGQTVHNPLSESKVEFELVDVITDIYANGERLSEIPAWPLNGSIEAGDPLIMALVDKEVSLYNKISRRNHLLYGASTYTPVLMSDMSDEEFDEVVNSGLGTWIKLRQDDDIKVLETPTAALSDMDRAIVGAIEEMAKLGIRMLSPESAQSGVALEIRNAAQTAQLGTLSTKISMVMQKVITFMINWRYGTEFHFTDFDFQLSTDFNPIPLGADWLRLATEWYQGGLIPRSIWLQILKQNDMIMADYNDNEGQMEINSDDLIYTLNDVRADQAAQSQTIQGE
jgi:uncharacterized short protein YbdD (DUF466 family)